MMGLRSYALCEVPEVVEAQDLGLTDWMVLDLIELLQKRTCPFAFAGFMVIL